MVLNFGEEHSESVIFPITKKLKLNLEQFKQSTKRPKSSLCTKKINDLDEIRNQEIKEIARRIKYFTRSGNTEQKESAQLLQQILKAYKNLKHQHINTETAVIQAFFTEIEQKENIKTAIATLALSDFFLKLETLNREIEQLSIIRAQEKENKPLCTGPEARKILIKTYQNLCSTLEAVLQLNADAHLQKIFEQLNGYRKEYHTLLLAIRPKKDKKYSHKYDHINLEHAKIDQDISTLEENLPQSNAPSLS